MEMSACMTYNYYNAIILNKIVTKEIIHHYSSIKIRNLAICPSIVEFIFING